ncbi:SAV_2336 N-terminal domain-related protein [Streptomyces niveiscabiei]|uniref:SAV_2336 N-terminal domain-related protein n=1 Tax=Streptomyces niveiscabiei TaxID=164115 RepID=UPI0029A323A5|nr:SAV_2336 N-terminal domain-related protein [Streptomyces niveiscabiei]MDX3384043.1 SAV_2336 N-terminal domain-related protein [Streptomyces niveiscabiei]
MGSEGALARLAALLDAAAEGTGPTPRELAEVLWFARQLSDDTETPSPDYRTSPAPSESPVPWPAQSDPAVALPPTPDPPRVPLHLPDASPTPAPPSTPAPAPSEPPADARTPAGGTPLSIPVPPMLPHPLTLQRALRPLKRTVPAPHARLLDEPATADRIARLGASPEVWLPVLRPARDRWLRVCLVHDTGPTMPVWQPLVRELHTVLAQSGIFRTVSLHPLTPDGRTRGVVAPADGRTAILVLSDCMGPQWRPGPAGDRWYGTLRHWATHAPLAVVQPLPEHLWPATALPAEPGLFASPALASPASRLAFTPYDPDVTAPSPDAVALPVMEPDAPWLANWASLLTSPGGGRIPGAAAWLTTGPAVPEEASDIRDLTAREIVLRFESTASPEAFRLAGHLSLAAPSVPVMRLVQHTVQKDPRPQHLAEVILSGMLTAVDGPPGSYAFRPGVRELLQRTLPRTVRGRTSEFLARIGELIDVRAGFTPGAFRALGGGGAGDGEAFATVRGETVDRLGGTAEATLGETAETAPLDGTAEAALGGTAETMPGGTAPAELLGGRYRVLGQRGPGQRVREAVDTRTGERVVVHLYPEQPEHLDRFTEGARALAGVDSPYVTRVLDHGVEGQTPYLVAEFVEGVTLSELLLGSGPGVCLPVYAALVADVQEGLRALHAAGLVRGQTGGNGLLLRADGTVLISRFALGQESVGKGAPGDAVEFHRLAEELTRRSPDVQDFRARHPEQSAQSLRRARRTEHLQIRTTAPLRVTRGSVSQDIHSPELMALLVKLLHERGRRVTSGELARVLPEGNRSPSRIRELIAELAVGFLGPGTVAEVTDGYVLHLPAVRVRAPQPLHFETLTPLTPESRITLEYVVDEVLSRGGLTPAEYETHVLPQGYRVDISPDTYLVPLLAAAVRWLPGPLAALADPPRLHVTFGGAPAAPPGAAQATVTVPPALHESFAGSSAAYGPHRFRPLYGEALDSPPLAWYCPLPAPRPEDDDRDLVKGPYLARDLRELHLPAAGRSAVVHALPDAPLTLLNPAQPYGNRRPGRATYYEVDLTPQSSTRELRLPSSGKARFAASARLTWRVTDPVAFVRAEVPHVADALFAYVAERAPGITRHHSHNRPQGAERALGKELTRWPVPGLQVSCEVRIVPYAQQTVAQQAAPDLRALLAAPTVLLGFDGPLTRLFPAARAREAALALLAVAAEHRNPQDALAGRPFGTAQAQGGVVHPLEVLRTYAHDPVGPLLRARLDELELAAVPDAPTTHNAVALVRALHAAGKRVLVATDCCEEAVRRYVAPYRLPLAGVHGRADDPAALMPDPDCLRRALGEEAGHAVFLGSTVAGLTAAQRAGLPFIGLARNRTVEQELREAGGEVVVRSLAPVLEAARSLGRG